jgi:hypothetical protein
MLTRLKEGAHEKVSTKSYSYIGGVEDIISLLPKHLISG